MPDRINPMKDRKPFYKKWWLWLIAIIFIFIIAGNSMNKNKNQLNSPGGTNTTDNNPTGTDKITPGTVKDGITNAPTNMITGNNAVTDGQKVEDKVEDIKTTAARDNSSAKLTNLNTGTFIVGTDIPAGRYVVTGDGSGNLIITDKIGLPYVNEILGGGNIGVKNVTTDINDGDSIKISGINKAVFTPAKTVLSKDYLTTGNWLAGVDVVPGRYDITGAGGSGNLIVYDKNGLPEVNEILGGEIGVKKVTADLKEGYKIVISGLNKVNLIAK